MDVNRGNLLLLAALAMFIIAALVAGGVLALSTPLLWIAIGLACWVANSLI